MSRSAHHTSTLAERLAALPDHVVGEVVAGELHVSPRPAALHALAASAVQGELWAPFRRGRGGPGGWHLLVEPELHFGDDVLVPDIAGWRVERLPVVEDRAYFELAPDWACEVVSPSTARVDRMKKMPVYLREGVRHLWLVDPLNQALEVFRAEGDRWILAGNFGGATKVRAEPFDAIELDLAALWGAASVE